MKDIWTRDITLNSMMPCRLQTTVKQDTLDLYDG